MVINTLKIRNFGKIHDRTLELSEGINVLYGENESGKTTIHTFLKSMLFGMARLRGKGARTDTYSTYEPWENPADYGGTIWFTQEGCEYRLTRNFESSHPVFELVRLTDGAVFTDEEEIAALLGEVSEAVYDNTVSVGQLKSVTGKDLVRELQNYMASYQGTGDTSLDLGRAAQMLKMSRKGFQVQAERRKKELQKEQEKLDAGMDLLEKEMTDLQTKRGRIDEKGQSLRLGENGGDVLLRHIREGVPHIPILNTVNVHADHRAVCGARIHIHPGVIGNAPRRRERLAPFLLGDPRRIGHDLLNEGGAV